MRCERRKEHSRWQERERVSADSDSNVLLCDAIPIVSSPACLSQMWLPVKIAPQRVA